MPTYSVIPGTIYINYQPTTAGEPQTWTHYRTSFTVPSPPSGTRVFNRRPNLDVHADNVVKVFFDEYLFYEQPWTDNESNFQDAPEADSLLIAPGNHVLRFGVYNFAEQTALHFQVTVTETVCEPCYPYQRICNSTPL